MNYEKTFAEKMNQCSFIKYDKSKKDICDDLLKDKTAVNICRELIHISAIEDIITNDEINGYVVKMNEEYVGFIFFKQIYDSFYLNLIATKAKLGFPLGRILMSKLEEDCKKENGLNIQANAIPEALNFYKKLDYDVKYQDEESGEYLIQKNFY